jgi:phosphatidylglycerophosphate synthase
MITLIGLVFMLSSILIIFMNNNKFEKESSPGLLIYLAISLFMYQTLDAVDGKHARNTKRCSPLGQLLDHGCDCLTNNFIMIQIFQAYNIQDTNIILLLLIFSQVNKI